MEASLNSLKEDLRKIIDEKCDLDSFNIQLLEDIENDDVDLMDSYEGGVTDDCGKETRVGLCMDDNNTCQHIEDDADELGDGDDVDEMDVSEAENNLKAEQNCLKEDSTVADRTGTRHDKMFRQSGLTTVCCTENGLNGDNDYKEEITKEIQHSIMDSVDELNVERKEEYQNGEDANIGGNLTDTGSDEDNQEEDDDDVESEDDNEEDQEDDMEELAELVSHTPVMFRRNIRTRPIRANRSTSMPSLMFNEHGEVRQERTQSTIIRTRAIRRVHTVADNDENFTITVDLVGCKEVVVYPAKSGVQLKDAIAELAETHNFAPSGVAVFIESSDSPAPLDCDCSLFAKRQLFLREKDDEIEGRLDSAFTSGLRELLLDKRHYFRPRAKPVNLLTDRHRSVSTSVVPQIHVNDDFSNSKPPIIAYNLPKSGGKKDLSKFLGVETDKASKTRRPSAPTLSQLPAAKKMDPKLQMLQDKLDYYMLHGLPEFPSLIFAYPQREDDTELLTLEDNWRDVVSNHAELPKKVIEQQEAIWEIVHTEVTYIKNIRVIIDLYLTCLIDLQAAGILNSIQSGKIFSNITDIEYKHSTFWKEKLINVMKITRETSQPLSAGEVVKAFEGFGDHFQPYIKFCAEEGLCIEFLKAKLKEDDQLKLFLQWCQDYSRKQTRRKLSELLVHPMQRITKYPLLLQAVAKKTENETDKQAILRELAKVKTFCDLVNQEVTREQETKKMKIMVERIELYDWPEIPPAGSGSDEVQELIEASPIMLDLHFPIKGAIGQPRWVVYEGPVKIKDQYDKSRFEGTIVIFTDMMTICKKGQTKENSLRICRPPIRIDRVKTAELKDGSGFVMLCSDDYNCACTWYIITTQNTSDWLRKINKAKDMYETACDNKDMDKFLDTSQSANHLELPDFRRDMSPRASPTNSPRMRRQFSPGINVALAELTLNEKELHDENGRKDSMNEGDSSLDKESFGESSTEDESTDAEEGQTPTLTRISPSDIFFGEGEPPGSFDEGAGFISPTTPTCDPNALNIMQFDSDLEEEDPLQPTPFCVGMGDPSTPTPKRTTQKGAWGKVFNRPQSRKLLPNGVTKTKEQLQDIPPSKSDRDQAGADVEHKQGKKTNRRFIKKQTKTYKISG
ncbi:pleckstrin homology domain-containing family G member 5-like isoform X3 [Amphiura filiformis]|uniref:pleckstrin homology domain-containing family G member 5-like isoform X3 n=1 Tax=Amphiura filiformis TaxID=82378 RepID=UPI003B210EF9